MGKAFSPCAKTEGNTPYSHPQKAAGPKRSFVPPTVTLFRKRCDWRAWMRAFASELKLAVAHGEAPPPGSSWRDRARGSAVGEGWDLSTLEDSSWTDDDFDAFFRHDAPGRPSACRARTHTPSLCAAFVFRPKAPTAPPPFRLHLPPMSRAVGRSVCVGSARPCRFAFHSAVLQVAARVRSAPPTATPTRSWR